MPIQSSEAWKKRAFEREGFTLIEVIVSIVLVAILGTMLVTFMRGTVTMSTQPVLQARDGSYLYSIMENMTADYNNLFLTDSTPLATFEGRIGSENSTQTLYSDAQHPYTIVHNRRISFTGTGSTRTEQADTNGNVLKVTINYREQVLTALFSE